MGYTTLKQEDMEVPRDTMDNQLVGSFIGDPKSGPPMLNPDLPVEPVVIVGLAQAAINNLINID